MSNMALGKKWGRLEFKKYIKPTDKVVILAFPFFCRDINSPEEWDIYFGNENSAFYDYFTEPFEFFGVAKKNIKWINYFTDTPQSAKNKIKSANIILISDGVPRQMMEIIDELDLTQTLKDYKRLIIGIGYGAVIQLADYQVEPCSLRDFQYFHGLGIIDSIGIETGFEEFDFPNISLRKFLEEKKKPIYALHDEGAVIIGKSGIKAVGDVDVIASLQDLEEGIKLSETLRAHLKQAMNN